MVFDYTVGAALNQTTPDLQVIGVTSGGWSVTDSAGDRANLSAAIQDLGLAVDTNTPAVSGLSAGFASGSTVSFGETVKIDLELSDAPLAVSGAPTLKLSDGGVATYNPSSSAPASGILEFDYTVTSGQSASNLKITGVTVPSGASIKDLAGNAANLTLTSGQRI